MMFEKHLSAQGMSAPSTISLGKMDLPAATPNQQIGHIAQHLQEHDRLTMNLADELGLLEARLSIVLRPAGPDGGGANTSAPTPVVSPLAEGLNEFNLRLYRAIERVRSMTARVDM